MLSASDRLKRLQALLKSPDPEAVYQGVTLAETLGDARLYATLLKGAWLRPSTVGDRLQVVEPGEKLRGPTQTTNLRAAATLALIADAPPGVAVAERLRPRITRLALTGSERRSRGRDLDFGPGALWHLDRLPALEELSLYSFRLASAHRLPATLPALSLLRSPVDPAVLAGAGLHRIARLHLFRHSPALGDLARLTVDALSLNQLDVSGPLTALATIPGLTDLTLTSCRHGDLSLPLLPGLRGLTVSGNRTITALSLQQAPGLSRLTLRSLEELAALTDLPTSLETMDLRSLSALKALPMLPASLQSLKVHNLPLGALPPLPPLRCLEVGSCRALAALPMLPATLEELNVSQCPRIAALPEVPAMAEGARVKLHYLNLTTLDGLTRTTGMAELQLYYLTKLTRADLSRARSLATLFVTNSPELVRFRPPKKLRYLSFSGCPEMQVHRLPGLPSLEILTLSSPTAPHRRMLSRLPALRCLRLSNTRPPDALGATLQVLTFDPQHAKLSDLSAFQVLEWLWMSGKEPLQDITGLSGLPALQSLHLSQLTPLCALAPLATLPALRHLTLHTRGARLTGLRSASLQTLEVEAHGLSSLAGLKKLPALTGLTLTAGRKITNLSALARCPRLADVSLSGITGLRGLQSTSLRRLRVFDSPLQDLTALTQVPALQELWLLHSQQLPSEAFDQLARMPHLERLVISHATFKRISAAQKRRITASIEMAPLRYPDWQPGMPHNPLTRR